MVKGGLSRRVGWEIIHGLQRIEDPEERTLVLHAPLQLDEDRLAGEALQEGLGVHEHLCGVKGRGWNERRRSCDDDACSFCWVVGWDGDKGTYRRHAAAASWSPLASGCVRPVVGVDGCAWMGGCGHAVPAKKKSRVSIDWTGLGRLALPARPPRRRHSRPAQPRAPRPGTFKPDDACVGRAGARPGGEREKHTEGEMARGKRSPAPSRRPKACTYAVPRIPSTMPTRLTRRPHHSPTHPTHTYRSTARCPRPRAPPAWPPRAAVAELRVPSPLRR